MHEKFRAAVIKLIQTLLIPVIVLFIAAVCCGLNTIEINNKQQNDVMIKH